MYAKHATYLRRDRSTPTSAVSIASRLSNSGPRVSAPPSPSHFHSDIGSSLARRRVLRLMFPMISFSRISKQYGRQVLFVDASFQLNPGEKVGLVGPNGAGKTTLFRMIVGEEAPDEGDVSVPKKLTIGYFRQDVEEMSGRSVLDEAIAGSGRVGDLHHELEALQARDGGPGARRTRWTRSSPASARSRRSTSISAATRSRARRAKCCTASASTTSGSTAMSARCRAAGRCGSRWPACCSGGRTSC